MDVGLKLEKFGLKSLNAKMFQSLFWWMLVLNTLLKLWKKVLATVSILVLVDVGLKQSFLNFRIEPFSVSILVLVDVGLKLKLFKPNFSSNFSFQSLFWWMLVLN